MSADVNWRSIPSPAGPLTAFAVNNVLAALEWGGRAPPEQSPTGFLEAARGQLNAYFDGRLTGFSGGAGLESKCFLLGLEGASL